uniref:hypothetical protein n=1 Tax=Sphingomonas sp. TaxID=28214 RepID=UPI003B3A5DD4
MRVYVHSGNRVARFIPEQCDRTQRQIGTVAEFASFAAQGRLVRAMSQEHRQCGVSNRRNVSAAARFDREAGELSTRRTMIGVAPDGS